MNTLKNICTSLALICLMINSSCQKTGYFCGAQNPTTEIPWIKNLIDNHGTDSILIYKQTYNSKEGFLVANTHTGSGYFNDCNGVNICSFSAGWGIASGVWQCKDNGDFNQETTYKLLIYSSY